MPVVLPPPNQSEKTCLLYMEAFDIIIPNSRFLTVGSEGKNRYSSEPDHYKCNISSSRGGARYSFFFCENTKISSLNSFSRTMFRISLLERHMN